ncbi:hypothetical protein KOE80_17730 [Alcaligenes sp. 13f]|nr:hypothetical protein [Alcaligenes sp. 13f]MCB4324048.1 hypothetical protein [Alcaligenes sp. 13f]
MTQTTSSTNKPPTPPLNRSPSPDHKPAMHPDDKKDDKAPQDQQKDK